MKVLITKQDEPFFLLFNPKFEFTESSENTCTFKITTKKFSELYTWIRTQGYNPYAIMHW